MRGKGGEDRRAVARGEDACFEWVDEATKAGAAGSEFVAKECKVRKIDTRRDIVNEAEEMGYATEPIIARITRSEACGGAFTKEGVKRGKEAGHNEGGE